MKSYKDIGLNNRLQGINGLAARERPDQRFKEVEAGLDRGGITTAKLGTSIVGIQSLADNSVTTAKIANNAVTNPKLGNQSVDTTEIADQAITATKLAQNSVGGTHIADGAITDTSITDFDFAKGTGIINTAGSIETDAQYSVAGTVGVGTTIAILDGGTAFNHDLTFTGGLLTSYGTSGP